MSRTGLIAVALAGLSVLAAGDAAAAAWVKLEPPDAGFSVFFPAAPNPTTIEKPDHVTHIWTVHADNLVCLIAVADYKAHIDAERELDLDMKNFLMQIRGTATSQQKVSFRDAPDGPLPALQFSFSQTGFTGRSLIVVSGDRTYQAAASVSGTSETPDVSRCIAFKVTAPSRHWQAP